MKNIKIFLTLPFFVLLSCSSDTTSPSNPSTDIVPYNLPLTISNYWVYEVEDNSITTRDSLYISNDTVINNITYKKPKVKGGIGNGFFSNSLNNNGIRREGNNLKLTGELNISGAATLPITLDISLTDFIIFDIGATDGTQLDSKMGSFEQTVNSIPLTINYTLFSFAGEFIPNYISPNNVNYTNVKKNKIIMKVSITTPLLGIPITVLSEQDLLISNQYFAENIGMVYTNTVFKYTINQDFATQLGIPATTYQAQNENLTSNYQVN